MPATTGNIEQVQKNRQVAAAKMKEAGGLMGDAQSFRDFVMEDVRSARAARGVDQLSKDIGNATGQLELDPTNIRGRSDGIVNPMDVDALTSRARAQNLNTLATTANVQAERTGSIEDMIGAGTNRILSLAKQKESEANQAKSEADALMEKLSFELQQRKQAFDEYMKSQELALAKSKASGGGGTPTGWEDYLKLYNALKPSATQEQNAINAQSGLTSINRARELAKSGWNTTMYNVPGLNMIGETGELRKNVQNLTDVLTRARTGAALNKEEEDFYNKFTANPLAVLTEGPKEFEKSFKIMEDIFSKTASVGRDPREVLMGDFSKIFSGLGENTGTNIGKYKVEVEK